MRKRSGKKSISNLATLLLLGLFAAGILAVLLSGAGAYRRLTERDCLMYDSRTCVQYVATKLRQAPCREAVTIADFGDGDSLVVRESIEGMDYVTRVYCHDGWLMELFTADEAGFEPEDGEKIMQAGSLELEKDGDLLKVELVDGNGTASSFALYLRGGEGG